MRRAEAGKEAARGEPDNEGTGEFCVVRYKVIGDREGNKSGRLIRK